MKSIRANILVGVFLTIPIVVTILIFKFLVGLATDWLVHNDKIENLLGGRMISILGLRIITLAAIVLAFYFVGLFVRNMLGKRVFQLGDHILTRIPIIKGIYVSIRQISESLFTQRNTLFKEVVLVEYPRKGLYSLAFVTAEAPLAVASKMADGRKGKPCVSLFISTTPNPTSGVFILVPRSEVISLDIPVTDALTFIMSAGAVAPGDERTNRLTLLDKLEAWLKHGDASPTQKTTPALPEHDDATPPTT